MARYAEYNIPNYRKITSIPDEHSPNSINTNLAQDWNNAFYNCRNLTNLPDPFYNTSNATNMYYTFSDCRNLTTIPNFDTSNVTSMYGMFYYCNNITTSPNFNTSNVTDMTGTFHYCENLTTVPNFDTGNVTSMADMFRNCYNLITVPNFDMSNVITVVNMFANCRDITTVPNFNTSKVKYMSYMFDGCNNLTTVPNFDTSNVTDMTSMFDYGWNLTIVPNFNTNKVTDMYAMFSGCNNLATIPNFNTSKVTNMGYMFEGCHNLVTVPDFNTDKVTNMSFMFSYCYNLTSVPNFNTINTVNMRNMFQNCSNLTTVPNFDTSNVTSMRDMFDGCKNLNTIPNFDTSNVTDMRSMFSGCDRLTTVPNFDTGKVTDMSAMFFYCWNLTTVPNFDTSNVTDMPSMFYGCHNLTTVPNFDTSNATNMRFMLIGCWNLTTVPNFDTSNVTDMLSMFSGCNKLTKMPIFNTNKIIYINNTFEQCSKIQGDFYIFSNNVINAAKLFANTPNYTKNIYCHANTTTYNTIYTNMGNNTYNSNWNSYLKVFENDYAEILWTGNGIYRFPTNKIQMMYTDNTPISTIEILPYTDYQLNSVLDINNSVTTYAPDLPSYINHNGTKWGEFAGSIKFRFFKDITNMTHNIIDPAITIQGLQDLNSEIYVNNKKYNSNSFYCEFEGEQLLEIYSPNYLFISQEINIPKNTSISVDVGQNRNNAAKVTIIPSISEANITYKYGTMTNYGIVNDDGTFYAPKNTDIEYIVKLTGYKTVSNIINISEDTVINITLEIAHYEEINITTPFTDSTEYLTNLVDDNNFEISGDYIQSGSSSYHKYNGTSYGYIQFITPDEAYIDSPIEVECYVSSENNYDYAAVYIGTQVYEPSRTQIKNKTTDGNGEFIFAASGNGSLNTYTYSNLLPNTTYYLSFAYAKDSSGNSNSDRFFIKSIRFRVDV